MFLGFVGGVFVDDVWGGCWDMFGRFWWDVERLSDSFRECRNEIFDKIKILNWNEGFYRKDIGYKVIDE